MIPALRSMWVAAVLASPLTLSASLARAEAPTQDGVHVRLNDLDLTRQSNIKTLYNRIHVAATRYCESIYSTTGSRISAGYDSCVGDAVNNTVQSLHLPSLTALHSERSTQQKRS